MDNENSNAKIVILHAKMKNIYNHRQHVGMEDFLEM